MNLEQLKAKHKVYTDAVKFHREQESVHGRTALANEGAAQGLAALIADEEKELADKCKESDPPKETPSA